MRGRSAGGGSGGGGGRQERAVRMDVQRQQHRSLISPLRRRSWAKRQAAASNRAALLRRLSAFHRPASD